MYKKILIALVYCIMPLTLIAQKIDAAYAKALHKKYPSIKTDFCRSCKLWINPYYKSIADTARHMPLLTFYVYTKG